MTITARGYRLRHCAGLCFFALVAWFLIGVNYLLAGFVSGTWAFHGEYFVAWVIVVFLVWLRVMQEEAAHARRL